jgi:hypothetical protein
MRSFLLHIWHTEVARAVEDQVFANPAWEKFERRRPYSGPAGAEGASFNEIPDGVFRGMLIKLIGQID